MKAIAVDDEIYMLENLQEAVSASSDVEAVEAFSSCSAALAYAAENPVDIAFLDINMRGIGGLGLAEKLLEMQPRCKIVFCTGYEEYAVSAFQLHVSGYLMKPITPEAVQKEIDHVKGIKAAEKLLTIRCFGNFEQRRGNDGKTNLCDFVPRKHGRHQKYGVFAAARSGFEKDAEDRSGGGRSQTRDASLPY